MVFDQSSNTESTNYRQRSPRAFSGVAREHRFVPAVIFGLKCTDGDFFLYFLPADAMSVRYMHAVVVCVSVRLSVRRPPVYPITSRCSVETGDYASRATQ